MILSIISGKKSILKFMTKLKVPLGGFRGECQGKKLTVENISSKIPTIFICLRL
jgi:hypothetical protein